MAWLKAVGPSLILAAALVGCEGSPEDEDEPYYMMENQMRAAMLSDAKRLSLLEKATSPNPEMAIMYIDIAKRVCKKHEEPAPLHMWVMHTASSSYVPKEQFTEVAYYCMQDYMWYYRYISADKKTDVIMGPYFVERQPQGGGAEYRRGGPAPHR
jgi:hypothetical protein